MAAEFAFVKMRATKLQQLAGDGDPRARRALRMQERLDAYLSATQLGITLASLGLGWLGEPAIAHLIEPLVHRFTPSPVALHTVAAIIAFAVITALHITLGELMPKSLAIQRTEQIILSTAAPLDWFYRLTYPVIYALNGLSGRLLRLIGVEPANERDLVHSEEEIRMLVSASTRQGVLDETERDLIDNVFQFADRVVREVMIPRRDMVCLYTDKSMQENIEIARREGYNRYPLCEGDKDHVIGLVHIKDLFGLGNGFQPVSDLRLIRREILMVPETLSTSRLLKEFQRRRSHMAVVVDEFGGTAGLVTLEDLLEEIVGEIQDEFDEETPRIQTVGVDVYEVDGGLLLDEAAEAFGLRLESGDVDTLGGYIMARLGRVPRVGDRVEANTHCLEVAELDGAAVARVRVTPRGARTGAAQPGVAQSGTGAEPGPP